MPTYKVTDPQTGRTLRLTGDSPPSKQELEQIFAALRGPVNTATISADNRGMLDRAFDAIPNEGIPGVLKGATTEVVNSVAWAGDKLRGAWNAVAPDSMDVERPYQESGPRPATTKYEELGQRGVQAYEALQGAKGAAALAKAGWQGAKAVPELARKAVGASTRRAAGNIEAAAKAANPSPMHIPSEINKPLTEMLKLEAAGGTIPKPVRRLMDRLTDPDADPLTFEEGRRFYHTISQLTQQGGMPTKARVMRAEVVKLRGMLHDALTKTADDASQGAGALYDRGIKEYAKGRRYAGIARAAGKEGVKDAARLAGLGALGKWLGILD